MMFVEKYVATQVHLLEPKHVIFAVHHHHQIVVNHQVLVQAVVAQVQVAAQAHHLHQVHADATVQAQAAVAQAQVAVQVHHLLQSVQANVTRLMLTKYYCLQRKLRVW